MGMCAVITGFDSKCPICNAPMKEFQTGEESGMAHFTDVTSFVGWCSHCDARVDYSLKPELTYCQAVVQDSCVRKVTVDDFNILVKEGKPRFVCEDCKAVNPMLTIGKDGYTYCNACGASYRIDRVGGLVLRTDAPEEEREQARDACQPFRGEYDV